MSDMKKLPAAEIGGELLLRRGGSPVRNRLEFDPESGELRLRPRGQVSVAQPGSPTEARPQATFIDQIASDGFA